MRQHVPIAIVVAATAAYGCIAPQDEGEKVASDTAADTTSQVSNGTHDFHDGTLFSGNGRACSDCHVDKDEFQLRPSTVEARYQALQKAKQTNPDADDPLFRPIDADDFRTKGDKASNYSNLRQNGLVRITFKLPSNVKLVDPATGQVTTQTYVDVWRSVPSVYNVKLTGPDGADPAWPRGPNTRGGYQLDARVDTLQNQALGAFIGHAQVKKTPSSTVLNEIGAYENTLFSSDAVRNLAKAIDAGLNPSPDIDGTLTDVEQQGKAVYQRQCINCHGGYGLSTPQPAGPAPLFRYNFIASGCARPVDWVSPARWQFAACPTRLSRNIQTYEITLADGTVIRRQSSDPGRFLLTGVTVLPGTAPPFADDWEVFDNAPLRGIAKTAPYFHNNSANTLADVVDHYQQLFKFFAATSGQPVPQIADSEKAPLVAYLNRL